MRIEPTQRASHLSWAGLGLVGAGLALVETTLLSYGAALLFGVAFSRALAQLGVARMRAAGFEMLWNGPSRAMRARRGQALVLSLELRNRDRQAIQFRDLHVTHSPALEVVAHQRAGEIPANGKLRVSLRVLPSRVGYQGIHGLTLTAVQAPGLFTVPLAFSSPVVVEVLPQHLAWGARGSRERARRRRVEPGAFGRTRGEGTEFHELREHQAGDAFKHIAWKASARRGRLLVAEHEQTERDTVWLLVDASLESAAGVPGEAPLDHSLDEVARSAERHIGRGDNVGLILVAHRELRRVPLGRGPRQLAKILEALAFDSHTADADRSEWDDRDVQRRVVEHLRSLDPRVSAIGPADLSGLEQMVKLALERSPVRARVPWASKPREALFLQYLLSFGIQPPPRGSNDRARTEQELARQLRILGLAKPRPSLISMYARAPGFDSPRELIAALQVVVKRRVAVEFHAAPLLPPAMEPRRAPDKADIIRDALRARLEVANARAGRELRGKGVRFRPPRGA